MKFGNIDLQKLGELQNVKMQNLSSTPAGVVESQFWYDTANKVPKFYNGTAALEFGKIYTFDTDSFTNTNDTITLNAATASTLGGVIIGNNISINNGTISVASASTNGAGVIEIATDAEASTGTSETLAINPKQLATKIGLSDISIASGSANYLGYNNVNGQISANVDTTVTASSTNLITSGGVALAISNALTGALTYQGTWTATSQTDYSSITLPVKKGYMYAVSGNATIGGVEWNSGDYLVINKDVASGGTITSADVEKIDNTEASDIVRLSATQTLTNKTIDADDNTISDLTTSNFKSGTIVTAIGSTGSDSAIPTEKAVRDALSITSLSYSTQNTALTVSGGVCTWTVTHNLNTTNVNVSVYEVSTGDKVIYDTTITSANVVTIKILSANNIAADTYKVVVLG